MTRERLIGLRESLISDRAAEESHAEIVIDTAIELCDLALLGLAQQDNAAGQNTPETPVSPLQGPTDAAPAAPVSTPQVPGSTGDQLVTDPATPARVEPTKRGAK